MAKIKALQEKIMQFSTGTLHCPETEQVNLQSVLAETLLLDEQDILWLAIEKPLACIDNKTGPFDIVLNYQQSEVSFDLDVLGEANFVHEAPRGSAAAKALQAGKMVLAVKIIDIDYWEASQSWTKWLGKKLHSIFNKESEAETYTEDSQLKRA